MEGYVWESCLDKVLSKPVFLRFYCTLESPEGIVNQRFLGPIFIISDSVHLGWGLRIFISIKFLGDDIGVGLYCKNHCSLGSHSQPLLLIRITRGALENSNAKAEHKANYIRYAVGGIRIAVHQDF